MRKKFFTGDKLNDLIHDVAEYICSNDLSEYHVFTFKRMSCNELNPRYCIYLWFAFKKKEGSSD